MTQHEQKAEGAEFRTRAAQVDDIYDATAGSVCKGFNDWPPKYYSAYLHKQIKEAEARGAAEQRRKDAEGAVDWRPIGSAPRDGTSVLVRTVSTPETYGETRRNWVGRLLVVQHDGMTSSGFDMGWRVACPVGYGGIPDEWFEGWRPVDRSASDAALEADAIARAFFKLSNRQVVENEDGEMTITVTAEEISEIISSEWNEGAAALEARIAELEAERERYAAAACGTPGSEGVCDG